MPLLVIGHFLIYLYMKVFKPSDNMHTLKVVTRKIVSDPNLYIRYELKNLEDTFPLSAVDDSGYLKAEFAYDFKEGGSYELELYEADGKLLYRGKIYATDEADLENYKLTK